MELINKIIAVIKSKPLAEYRNESAENFAAMITGDTIVAPINQGAMTVKFMLSIPDILFWDKMQRFLLGIYRDYEAQIKMSSKFTTDEEYKAFTKRQIHLINQINDDVKIDFYSNLTRAFLLDMIDAPLYFKLSNTIANSIREELEYLKNNIKNKNLKNNVYINSFTNYGLAVQTVIHGGNFSTEEDENEYEFTPLAECLDRFALSYGNEEKYKYNSITVSLGDLSIQNIKSNLEIEIIDDKDIEELFQ